MTERQKMREAAKAKAEEAKVALTSGDKENAERLLAEAKGMNEQAQTLVVPEPEPTPVPETVTPVPVQLAQDTVTLTREQFTMLEQRQQRLETELQAAKVKELCDTALARGVPPAIVNTVMPVLMSCQRDAQATIKLTAEAEPVNLFGAVAAILEAVPGRAGEITHTIEGERPIALAKPVTTEEAEADARKRRKELGITRSAIDTEVEL